MKTIEEIEHQRDSLELQPEVVEHERDTLEFKLDLIVGKIKATKVQPLDISIRPVLHSVRSSSGYQRPMD